jgi:hypothetical protein
MHAAAMDPNDGSHIAPLAAYMSTQVVQALLVTEPALVQ